MKGICLIITIVTCLTHAWSDILSMLPHERITYNKDQLLALAKCPATVQRLSPGIYNKLTFNGINRIKPTRRGTKAGCNKQRSIPVLITDHTCDSINASKPEKPRTLTHIKCVPASHIKDQKKADICLINTRSVNNKCHKVKDHAVEFDVDICAITETWLKPGGQSSQTIGDLCPNGYKLPHEPRATRGGGIGLMHKKTLDIKPQNTQPFSHFEHSELLLKASSSDWIRLIVIYRPCPNRKNGFTVDSFLTEFQTMLERLILLPCELLILGDFNFHVDDPNDRDAKRLLTLLESFHLQQHVHLPTHIDGHTLDLVITRSSSNLITDLFVTKPFISDHCAVHFKVTSTKPRFTTKTVQYRSWKSVDLEEFKDDIKKSHLITS